MKPLTYQVVDIDVGYGALCGCSLEILWQKLEVKKRKQCLK